MCLLHVVGREERVSCSSFLATGCAANAVDVVLRVVGVVEVNDEFDVFDICGSGKVQRGRKRVQEGAQCHGNDRHVRNGSVIDRTVYTYQIVKSRLAEEQAV